MSKQLVLMRDLICKYHPEFVRSRDMRRCGLNFPHMFNVERLVEESLAAVGGYKFVDEEGYDFSDYSDSKTGTVNINTRKVQIGSVENKIGALRITIYNPHRNCLDFMFIPKRHVSQSKIACCGKEFHKERLMMMWNQTDNHYNKFEDFRVSNFEALAVAR